MEHCYTYLELECDIISKSFFKHFTKYAKQHNYLKFLGISEIELWYLFSRPFLKDDIDAPFNINEFCAKYGISFDETTLCALSKSENDFYENNYKVHMLEHILNMAKKGDTEAIDFLNLLKC